MILFFSFFSFSFFSSFFSFMFYSFFFFQGVPLSGKSPKMLKQLELKAIEAGDFDLLQVILAKMTAMQVTVNRKQAYSSLLREIVKSGDVLKCTKVIQHLIAENILIGNDLVDLLW